LRQGWRTCLRRCCATSKLATATWCAILEFGPGRPGNRAACS